MFGLRKCTYLIFSLRPGLCSFPTSVIFVLNQGDKVLTEKFVLPSVVVFSWLLATTGRLGWHGDVYGFNFAIFQPDGIYYAFKSLLFLGIEPNEGAVRVSNWFTLYSGTGDTYDPDYFLSTWSTYPSERILYSLLSTPFIHFMGLNGMLVIPIVSFLILLLNIYLLGKRLDQPYLGLGLAMLVSFSPTITRWMISSTPDSLLVGLISFFPLLYLNKKIKNKSIFMLLLVIGCSLTRFSLPIFILIAMIFFLHKKYRLAIIIFLSSLILSIPAMMHINTGFLPRNNGGMLDKIISLPFTFMKVGFVEVAQLAVLDRVLLSIIFTAFVMAIKFRRSLSSNFFFAILLAVWSLGTLNGSLGVNFRYQLPLIIFCCWVIFESSPRLLTTASTHIKIKEIKEEL